MSATIAGLTIVEFVTLIIQWLPHIKSGIKEVSEMVEWAAERVGVMAREKRDPTAAEWDELNRRTAELRRLLHSDTE